MGFGLLFIGYVLTFFMSMISYGYFFELAGILLMVYSFTKLSEYNKKFRYAFFVAGVLLIASIYSTVSNVAFSLGHDSFKNFFSESVFPVCKTFLNALFHASLFVSVINISIDTETNKIRNAAYRNAIVYGLYFALQLLFFIPAISDGKLGNAIGIVGSILWLLWVILDAIMIFSCYMNICDENDTDMKAKPSRFAFINNIRAEFDLREMKARESDKRYFYEKAEKRKNKKNAQKGKKN